ncbi:MAG: GGDEF domain-containing protein [Candidatus Omnitrophota bacterium]
MQRLIPDAWTYAAYINTFLAAVIFAVFSYRRRLLFALVVLFLFFSAFVFLFVADWQPATLGCLAVCAVLMIFAKVRSSFDGFKEGLSLEGVTAEKAYNDLVAKEGMIYDAQLKYNDKLAQISSLYEITKEMSTSLRFADIFKILAGYLHKTFSFKRTFLMLTNIHTETFSEDMVFEIMGMQNNAMKAKGIFPKLEMANRAPDAHDKKIYALLQNDIKRLQIARTQWSQNPYIQFLPEGAKTYMAVPIIIEKKIIGILAIEDLPTSDFEKFAILAAQFSLETRRIALYERVEQMAITDGLTKAFAKRHMMERLSEEFERSARHNLGLSFVMIDIDYFKKYNDTYGHLVGDIVLRDIVILIKDNTREVDLIGRFGGEEFCILLPETKKEAALLVSERIREIVEKHKFKAYDEMTDVSVSIGIATFPEDCKTAEELVENADKALYMAKSRGRNKVCLYQDLT